MHSAAGFANGDLGGEAYVQAIAVGEVADYPFCKQKLVCGGVKGAGEKLYLVLLIHFAVQGEIANLGVAVLYLAAGFGNVVHAFAAEVVELCKGFGLMVAFLVSGGEEPVFFGDDIVLQFSHGLELHSGRLLEGFFGPHESGVRAAVEGLSAFVVEVAEHAKGGNLVEGIHKCRAVTRNYVKV